MAPQDGFRLWFWLGCLLLLSPATAQEPAAYDVFLPLDHELRHELDLARTAIAEQRYNDAVSALGGLLIGDLRDEDASLEDYFVEPATEGSAQRSLKAEVSRLLAGLPKRGYEAFQLKYGREAELMFQEAIAKGDVEKLREVTRKYFYTSSGYEAAMLLGRYHLSQGRPLAAALVLKELHDLPVSQQYEPDLSLLLAASWLLADSPQRAKDVLVSLKTKQPSSRFSVGNQQVALFSRDDEALDWLRETLGKIDLAETEALDGWLVFRGNPQRNAPTEGGTPLWQERWAVPTPNDLKHQTAIKAQHEQYVKQQIPALPSLHPLVVRYSTAPEGEDEGAFRDVVITRSASRLLAVDFETGQRIWFYPWEKEPAAFESTSFSTPRNNAETPQVLKLKQRTWMDAPYGQLSTDGKRVFFIHELGLADQVGPSNIVVAGGIIRRNPDTPESHNSLVALELAREGYTSWTIGGEDGGDEPKLAGAFFLGPPLPLMDHLYAVAEVRGDIRLVVLDGETGKLQWQQQLCAGDNQPILDNVVRRLGGATPSYSEGVLVCPTSGGAVVAVDVAKRSLLWGYQYLNTPREQQGNAAFFRVTRRATVKQPGEAWADSSVTILGDRVFITPVEHDEIICLDLLNGTRTDKGDGKDKPLWRRPREDGLYVACTHDDNVVIVGQKTVTAVNADTGKEAWVALVPDSPKTMPSGRGFASGDRYFLPLTSGEIVTIDLKGGKLLEVTSTRGTLGNLICYEDTVISQGTTELASFYQWETLGPVVAKLLEKNPDDAWALARQGELLLREGKRTEALQSLRRSHELEMHDGTKELLVKTLLAALEDDFAANRKLAVEVESLIDRPDQRVAFLKQMAVGLKEVGDYQASFDFFLKMIDEAEQSSSSIGHLGDTDLMQQPSEQLQVRNERWIAGRIADLLRTAPDDIRDQIRTEIEQRAEKAISDGSVSSLRRFVDYFGWYEKASSVRLTLAVGLWHGGEYLEAELILSDLIEQPNAELAAQATAQLARLLNDVGHVEESAMMYRRLQNEFGDVNVGDGKSGKQVVSELAEESLVTQSLKTATPWPNGRVEHTVHKDPDDHDAPKLGYSSYQRVYPSLVDRSRGAVAAGTQIVLDRRQRLIVRDGLGRESMSVRLNAGRTSQYYTANYTTTHSKISGHLALVALGYELFAIDTFRNTSNGGRRVLWSKSLASPIASRTRNSRQHAVAKLRGNPWGGHRYYAGDSKGQLIAGFTAATSQGVVFRREDQMICFDPLREDLVYWVRDGMNSGSEIFGDDEVVLVVEHGSSIANIYSKLDGTELGEFELGPREGTWLTLGRKVLRWNKTDEGVTVALLDPWDAATGKPSEKPVVWSHEFSADAKGANIENEEIAILQPDGKFSVVDLQTGDFRFVSQLEAEKELANVYVLRGKEEYIVVANRPIDDAPAGATVQPVPGGYGPQGQYSPLVKGRVYALNRSTGEMQWPEAAVVEHFGFPLDQPTCLPIVSFMRNVSMDTGSPSRTWKTEVVCLDKRDGRIAFHQQGIQGNTQVYRIEGDAQEQSAAIMLPGESFTLRWTNNPRPPEPPAQLSSKINATDETE